jgi:hypothetical protein
VASAIVRRWPHPPRQLQVDLSFLTIVHAFFTLGMVRVIMVLMHWHDGRRKVYRNSSK